MMKDQNTNNLPKDQPSDNPPKEKITYITGGQLKRNTQQPRMKRSEESRFNLSQSQKSEAALQPLGMGCPRDTGVCAGQMVAATTGEDATASCLNDASGTEAAGLSQSMPADGVGRQALEKVLGETAEAVEEVLNQFPLTAEEREQTRERIANELKDDLARLAKVVTLKALVEIIARIARRHFVKEGLQDCDAEELAQDLVAKLLKRPKGVIDLCFKGNIGAYVATARNRLRIDLLKRKGRWRKRFGESCDPTEFDRRCDPRSDPDFVDRCFVEFPERTSMILKKFLSGQPLDESEETVIQAIQREWSPSESGPPKSRRKAKTHSAST